MTIPLIKNKSSAAGILYTLLLAGILSLSGCPSDDNSGGTDNSDTDDTNNTNTSDVPSSILDGNGNCAREQIMQPIALGDINDDGRGSDLIRKMRYHEPTGDIYFTAMDSFFRLPAGSDTAEQIPAEGLSILGNQFWIQDDTVIFPMSFINSMFQGESTVLLVMPLTGGTIETRLTIAGISNSLYASVSVQWAHVVGEDVYWTALVQEVVDGDITNTVSQAAIFKSPLSASEATEENTTILYTTPQDFVIEDVYMVGGSLFFGIVDFGDTNEDIVRYCMQLDPSSGVLLDEDMEANRGGCVVGGDAESMLYYVSNFDSEADQNDPGAFEIYLARVPADFSTEYRIADMSISSPNNFDAREDGLWTWFDWGIRDGDISSKPLYLYTQVLGEEQQLIGCAPDDEDFFALEIGPNSVFAARNQDGFNTILEYPLP